MANAAPRARHASTQQDACVPVPIKRLTSKIQELQVGSDQEARLGLARSITAVIKKNYKVPAGPEMNVVTMTRTFFGAEIDALKALVTQFMTALNCKFNPR